MKYVFQFVRIIIICFLGEVLSLILPFPVPAGIYGILLLFLALQFGIFHLDQIKETGGFFLRILTVLFVPAAVGIIDQWSELLNILLPCLLATIPVTILVMGISGRMSQRIHRHNKTGERRKEKDD